MKTFWPWMLMLGTAVLLGFALPAVAADAAGDKEPIKIELPDANFAGTPFEYISDNLEPYDFKDRPPFLAPKGTEVVSKGKPVTASVKTPNSGELKMLVDGDKGYVQRSMVELPQGVQWVQIDLGAEYETYAILLWHFHVDKRVYFDVVVQSANDPEFKTGVTTLYSTDYDNSTGLGVGKDKEYIETYKGRLIDTTGVKARYVRCYSNGNSWDDLNHYIEIEVFGKPVK
jgi:hypothetical protein